jgi:hypothetical protein
MATITTTADHPIWNHTDQEWQPVAALSVGDQLHTANGTQSTVVGILSYTEGQATAYNLTIADAHTYHVIAGNTPVLVHNDNEPSGTIARGPRGMTISIYANDHAPPHAHLKGNGFDIRIGQNGKPIGEGVTLTGRQQEFVDANITTLRDTMRAKMAEFDRNHPKDPVTGKRTGC